LSGRAVLRAQATLVENASAGRNMSPEFRLERPIPTADAAGGAAAFSTLADEFTRKLFDWVTGIGYCN
jgi:hypothetical protein